jgi:NitT/TauT family transport system permease protein
MSPLIILAAVLASTARVLGLILASIVTGWFLGYLAIKSKLFENAYTSLIGVFESVPVFSFFPVVLVLFVSGIGGYIGVELAADFLVLTAVVWNIWIGIYQAFKTVPQEMVEVAENLRLGFWGKMAKIYIPFSMPRIAANLLPSFADGFFYITVSEVFSVGASEYHVFGIGSLLAQLAANWGSPGFYSALAEALGLLGVIIAAAVYGIREFADYAAGKYAIDSAMPVRRAPIPPWLRRAAGAARGPLARLARYNARVAAWARRRQPLPPISYRERGYDKLLRPIGIAVAVGIVAAIAYGSVKTILAVPPGLWGQLFAETPQILLALAYDYARVAAISLLSLALAITAGYYLATHHRAERVAIPAIQVFSAYPAPAYFPLIFAATAAAAYGALGYWANELYAVLLGFISTFYYVFYGFWMGLKAMPHEVWELMDNLGMGYWARIRRVVLPATLPYIIAGLSSTIDSAWGGLAIGEYWPGIADGKSLAVSTGLMRLITLATSSGDIALAAWASLLFGVVVVLFSIFFTRRLMDLARKKYVVEEAIFAA